MSSHSHSSIDTVINNIREILVEIVETIEPVSVSVLNMRAFLRVVKRSSLPPVALEYANIVLDMLIDFECALHVLDNPAGARLSCVNNVSDDFLANL